MIDYSVYHETWVVVKWKDSITNMGWENTTTGQHVKEIPTITSLGYFLANETEFITLVADWMEHPDGVIDYNRAIKIPKGCISSVNEMPR